MLNTNIPDLFTLQAIFEGLEEAVLVLDPGHTITYCNAAAGLLFQYPPLELTGQPVYKLIPEELHPEQAQLWAQALEYRKPIHLKSIRVNKLLQPVPVSLTVSPVINGQDEVTATVHILRNISFEKIYGENQGLLAAIIENSDDAIISKDLMGYITSWNRGAEVLFGYTADEVIGKHITILIARDRLHEEDMILNKVRQGERIYHFHTERISKSGEVIPVSLSVSPVKNAEGQITGISKIVRGIAAQKIAAEKQEMLAAIVESSDDAIISKTLQGIITTWNKGAEKIFGYLEHEVKGKHISLLLPDYRLNEETTILESIKKGEKVDHFQTTRRHKNGWELDISLTVSPIKDINGVIVGASKVARDITEQKRSGEAIRQNAIKLEILNSIGKAISEKLDVGDIIQKVTDATTRITGAAFGAFFYNTVNEEGESFMLYSLSGASRKDFEHFGMPRNTAVFHPTFIGVGVVRSDDITKDPRCGKNAPHFGMPEGHLKVVSYLAVPVLSNSGTVIGGLFFGHPEPGMFLDEHEDLVVSLASQAAVALDNSKLFEEVRALSRKKDEFIALASHELKTPLTSMKGFLQVLQKKAEDELNRTFIEKTLNQLDKLNALVNDLFDISKIQSGKLQFNIEVFEFNAFLKEITETLGETLTTHHILFKPQGTLMVAADRMRIEQVIINLINNAAKYSPRADKIEVYTEERGAAIQVTVKDYGMGINEENFKHIFNRFYREQNHQHSIPGLGLGLYITKEIVERHHGQIWVESELGKGSSFIFSIPVTQPSVSGN